MRENEFLSSPFTIARLRHEPEMRIYKHDMALDGLCVCPYRHSEPSVPEAETTEARYWFERQYRRPPRMSDNAELEMAEKLREFLNSECPRFF